MTVTYAKSYKNLRVWQMAIAQLIISRNNKFISSEAYQELEIQIDEIGKMLISLQNKMLSSTPAIIANAKRLTLNA